jgi:malic enzyme
MLLAAARRIAELAPGSDLVPEALDRAVHEAVAAAVQAAA